MPWSPVGIASVYDRHQYADENERVMEAVAAKIMALWLRGWAMFWRSGRPIKRQNVFAM
jgi:hypothetical protein